jgi:hypothetical protein
MELSDELFTNNELPGTGKFANQHAVIVYFTYFKDDFDPLHNLDDELSKVIREQGVGEYDGHEIAMDLTDGSLYMYGPNAGELFKAVKPILEQTDFTRGAVAILRFGGAGSGADELEIEIER